MAFRNITTSTIKIFIKQRMVLSRGIVSALHIPGHLSKAAVSILTPDLSHIDLLITKDLDKLKGNLLARNISFHLDSFVEKWKKMSELHRERQALEDRRTEVSQKIKQISTQHALEPTTASKIEELKKEGIQLRSQLKDMTKIWWEVETTAVVRALSLPNELHTETPISAEDLLVYTFVPRKSDSPGGSEFHVSKSVEQNPKALYMKGFSAFLEVDWIRSLSQDWIANGYNLVSAPDFVRSLVIDGCGLSFNDPHKVLALATIQDHGSVSNGNGLHLVGGSSLPALVAFLTKIVIQDPFPLRLMSAGRCYSPSKESFDVNNQTRASQESSIHLLTATKNCPDVMFKELTFMKERISKQLEMLDIHFRVIEKSARRLEPWEQYRLSFEVCSSLSKKYIEAANVSIIGDYISKRLSIYGPDKEPPGFVSARALSVPKLLASF